MKKAVEGRPLLLRAVVTRAGSTLVTHSMLVEQDAATVRCDADAEIGDEITVELSFPGLLEPIELHGRLTEVKLPQGVGEPGTWRVEIPGSSDSGRRLAEIVAVAPSDNDTPYRVLCVEDNAMSREVLALTSKKFFGPASSVHLDFATSIENALSQTRANAYDLVIVDFFLPDGTGDELIRGLCQGEDRPRFAIVATSVGGEDASRAAMAAGADFFVDKPVVMPALFETINFLRGLKS